MIKKASGLTFVVLAVSLPAGAYAQSAADIFAEMDSRKRASIAEIRDMTRLKQVAGMCTLEYLEKETTESTDGRGSVDYLRLVPITEVSQRNSPDSAIANMSAEDLDRTALVMEDAGAQMSTVFKSEAAGANLPGGIVPMLMNPPPNEPWLSADPADMGGMYATMFRGAAEGKRQDAAEELRVEQEAKADPFAAVARNTKMTGREKINGRPALKLITEGLNNRQTTDGGEFVLQTMHLWVDADHYVPLKFQVDGIATQNGESRKVSIGREDLDFQTYPGCGDVREPSKSIMRMAGIMSPEEQAQMAEASAKMAEFEQQMASMPAAQKEMIMRQMGPQLEMMRGMASGKGIEMVTELKAMRCNTGAPANNEYAVSLPMNMGSGCDGFQSPGSIMGGMGAGAGASSSDTVAVDTGLVRMIQLDLARLGYETGEADGVLSRPTVVAITQFEAANGLEVTGRATPQLAGRLQAAVSALN